MGQHYTKNKKQVLHYCPTCNRQTMHRVDSGRMGCCLEDHRPAAGSRQLSGALNQRRNSYVTELIQGEGLRQGCSGINGYLVELGKGGYRTAGAQDQPEHHRVAPRRAGQ